MRPYCYAPLVWAGYVQDDWKATARLTENAGLRYELPLPFYETSNHYADTILELEPLYGTILDASNAAQYGYRKSFVAPNDHNLAPSLGLAYQLDPKTVVRAAGGIFYARDENVPVADRPTNDPPYMSSVPIPAIRSIPVLFWLPDFLRMRSIHRRYRRRQSIPISSIRRRLTCNSGR